MSRSQQEAFIDRFVDIAIEVSKDLGIAPEVVLGQAALESGWGAAIKGGNALGIKGKGQSFATKENIPGRGMVSTVESFRTYAKPEDSFLDYGRFMGGMNRYSAARNALTVDDQVAAIGKSGYATDPDYGKKLGGVVDRIQANRSFQDKVVNNAASYTPTAEVDLFSGVGIPLGQVEASAIPDLTPASAGFSFADFDIGSATLPADFSMDFSQYDVAPMDMGTFNDVFDAGFPSTPAPAQMSQNTFNDVFDAGFPAAPSMSADTFNAIQDAGFPAEQQGFSAGFGEGPYGVTPDFSAPSLEQRNALDRFEGAMAVRNTTAPDLTNEALAAGLMAELGPQAPSLAPAPVSAVTTPAPSASMPMGDIPDEFGPNFPGATPQAAPQAVSRAPQQAPASLPSTPTPGMSRTQQQVAKDYDLPSFDLPGFDLPSVPSIRDMGASLGLMDPTSRTGFMDAMANPDIARDWSPGFLDTRLGRGLAGAAMGFATGGPFGALTSGLWGGLGIGDMLGREFDRYANAYSNLSPMDFAAFMADGNPYDREPTRRDESGNATVGDGSYAERSGYNDNNPQGIL